MPPNALSPSRRRLRHLFATLVVLSILAAFLLSCDQRGAVSSPRDSMANYEAAKADALSNINLIREFKNTFGDNYLTYGEGFMYYSGTEGQTQWRASAVLYSRYQINMWLPVQLSEDRRQVISTATPRFQLLEFDRIEILDGGRVKISYLSDRKFGLDTWAKIQASQGRIEEVFEDIKKDSPVEHFQEYVEDSERRVRK